MDDVKPEIVHQVPHTDRHNDGLIGRHAPQCPTIQMIEVRMRHQDEIDFGQMMNFEPGLLQSLDHFQPLRPNRVDQDVHFMRLDQERGMSNPGDADFAGSNQRELRERIITGTPRKKRRNQNFSEKIALVPVGRRPQAHTRRSFGLSAVFRRLTDDIPSALFRKRNRHFGATI